MHCLFESCVGRFVKRKRTREKGTSRTGGVTPSMFWIWKVLVGGGLRVAGQGCCRRMAAGC